MKLTFLIKKIIITCAIGILCTQDFSAYAESENAHSFNIISLPDDKIAYVSMVDLAEKYNVTISYDPVMLSMTASRGENSLQITNQSRIALLNDTNVNMVFSARLIHGAMFAPVPAFLPLFSTIIPGTLTWNETKKEINVSGNMYTINNISFEEREGGTLIKIVLLEPLKFSGKLSDNNWLHLTFNEGNYDPNTVFEQSPMGLIRETRHFQFGGKARLSFKVPDEMESYSISKNQETDELLISLRYKRTESIPSSKQSIPDTTTTVHSINKDIWIIDTVAIDPGHGGKDSGAVGPGGTKEKDIVLKVAKELKKIIDDRNELKAVLTRDRDISVPLKQRAVIANKANSKLFISIHCNATKNKNVSGMEVFFLSAAKTESAQNVADLENASIRFEDNPEYYSDISDTQMKILLDMKSNVFLKESQDICKLVLDTAISSTRQHNRGVRQAGFYVMLGTQAAMPSILFEMGYISNPNEEKILRRVSYQKRVAQAIYDAIIEFKRLAERDIISKGN